MTVVRVPYGDEGVTIDASPEKPKEIVAGLDDVHLVFGNGKDGAEGLGADCSRTITQPVNVRSLDGSPTQVLVKRVRPGRSHDYPAAA